MNIDKNIKRIFSQLKAINQEISATDGELELLNRGGIANANLFRYTNASLGIDLAIKDFSACNFFIRNSVGRFLIHRECKFINALADLNCVAEKTITLSKVCFAYPFIEGKPLNEFYKSIDKIPEDFFLKLEHNVKEMHKRNIVHLDLRNLGNVLVNTDNNPYIIDFQSAIKVNCLPHFLKKLLFKSDLSGIYKCWRLTCEKELSADRVELVNKFNKYRRLWIFSGHRMKHLRQRLQRKN